MSSKDSPSRATFEFFVLEHRPEGERHPQARRVLRCIDFSSDGMRLAGEPRYDRFRVTLAMPHDDSKVDADVEVVNRLDGSFGVQFVAPSQELAKKLSWWLSSPAQGSDSAA